MGQKKDRILEIFFRLITGNGISIGAMAEEFGVSKKSITRDINEIKNFVAEHRDLLSNTEIIYKAASNKYFMNMDQFLQSEELFALVKLLIGCRAFSKEDTLKIIGKLRQFTSKADQMVIGGLISREVYHYHEVKHDCVSVIDNLWLLTDCISKQQEISITYYKMNRDKVERRIRPLAVTFSEYYYYLIGHQLSEKSDLGKSAEDEWELRFFRVDRIVNLIRHRKRFKVESAGALDEGDLMNRIQYMFPGKTRRIRFSFTGPSVQAVLDKLPRSRVVEIKDGAHIIEAEVLGSGINMFLLSQGSWVRPLAPPEFVEEMKSEVTKMLEQYSAQK